MRAVPASLFVIWRIFFGKPTVPASITAVLLIRGAALALLQPTAEFLPLGVAAPVFDAAAAVTLAAFVFLGTARYSLEPVRDYRSLAAGILALSFLPDIALAVLHWFGGGWPESLALMAMHVAVWAICVSLFPVITTKRA